MSLSGSINGQAGKLGGFLTLEGSEMGFRSGRSIPGESK